MVPGVNESDVVLQRVGAAEEVLQHTLDQLVGQEEVMPVVLVTLQVLVGRGLTNLLALGDIFVLLLGEVFCAHNAARSGLNLSIFRRCCCLVIRRGIFFCGRGRL